jgi:hypothetical protein
MILSSGWLAPVVAVSLTAGPGETTLPPLIPNPPEQRVVEGTDVHFLAYKGEEAFVVTVGDQSCTTPCTLKLRPGPTKVHVLGPGEMDLQMVIPHLTAQVRVTTGPPSWYLPTGVVLIPGGIAIGATLWTLAFACSGFNNSGCVAANAIGWPVVGVTMLVVGSVLLGISNRGIPLDANRPEILDARRPTSSWRFEGFSLAPSRNGLSGVLRLSF